MKHSTLLVVLVAALALAAGTWFAQRNSESAQGAGPLAGEAPGSSPAQPVAADQVQADLVGRPHPGFTLGAIDGRRVSADEFGGQVLLVNFWATWCAPCREEMPMLVELQEQYLDAGFAVVGIALDDVRQASDFAAELGINYTILVGGADVMAAGVAWGNASGTLPYSVLVNRDGIVSWTLLGPLHREELEQRVTGLL
jgi:thiol-disulfide isomerase/thioredoxin